MEVIMFTSAFASKRDPPGTSPPSCDASCPYMLEVKKRGDSLGAENGGRPEIVFYYVGHYVHEREPCQLRRQLPLYARIQKRDRTLQTRAGNARRPIC